MWTTTETHYTTTPPKFLLPPRVVRAIEELLGDLSAYEGLSAQQMALKHLCAGTEPLLLPHEKKKPIDERGDVQRAYWAMRSELTG
jgi:hypothetical protein